ncbi:DUF4232 domain-containing protein [Streptomyces sp. NPDC056831]|uniref:DUF4232 domain-containing protein n=1 Tax=Streptomyces sp. NPDC056831 TaxID=3345954 RepID=UPI0036935E27
MRSNRIRTTALAATALLAALSLTACSDNGSGDNGKAGAAAPAGSTADQQSPAATAPGSGKDAKDTKDADSTSNAPAENTAAHSQGSTSGTGGQKSNTGTTGQKSNTGATGNKGTGSKSPVTCTGSNTKVTVSKVSRPINHLLLTATNTGSVPCYAYHAPALRFDDAQAAFPVLRDSIPQAVVTLAPGQSAYASIGLSGEPDGQELHKSTHLTVYFTGKSNQGSTGAPAKLMLPAGTSWGDNGFVTYWQSNMSDALTY